MDFLHIMAAGRLVLDPEDLEWIPTIGGVNVAKKIAGQTIEFEPMSSALDWGIGRVFRGSYSTVDPEEIERLLKHDEYGVRFVAIDDDGSELAPDEWVFQELPDGKVKCNLTERIFKNWAGAKGHQQSKVFKEAMKDYLALKKANLLD